MDMGKLRNIETKTEKIATNVAMKGRRGENETVIDRNHNIDEGEFASG